MSMRMTNSFPSLELRRDDAEVPVYRQIALAVEEAVASKQLTAGTKLPPQRHLAQSLGVNLTTVSRAYTELQKRGIVVSGTGSGTYVRGEAHDFPPVSADTARDPSLIDLSINRPATNLYDEHLADSLTRVVRDPRFPQVQDYHPAEGAPWAREAGAKWIARSGLAVTGERVVVTSGTQEGLFTALSAITRPGDVIVTAQITYYGLKALANLLHLEIRGVAFDRDGLCPDAIEEACADNRVRAVFSVPCLHNPTTITVPQQRREEIVAVARRHGLFLIEDDVYGPLLPDRPPALAALYPERTFYVTGTSKTLAPGLRVGWVMPPKEFVPAVAEVIRSTCWMTAPLPVLIATRWIEGGTADVLLDAQRRELIARQELAAGILEGFEVDSNPVSTHLWLHLPPPWRVAEFTAQALSRGVKVIGSEVFAVGRGEIPHAVRINVSAARSREQLATGLRIIADALRERPRPMPASVSP